jgi:hypothetical protein
VEKHLIVALSAIKSDMLTEFKKTNGVILGMFSSTYFDPETNTICALQAHMNENTGFNFHINYPAINNQKRLHGNLRPRLRAATRTVQNITNKRNVSKWPNKTSMLNRAIWILTWSTQQATHTMHQVQSWVFASTRPGINKYSTKHSILVLFLSLNK